MAGRKVRDAADAHICLSNAALSGLTPTEWAREHGVNWRSLNAWRVRLEQVLEPDDRDDAMRLVELVPESVARAPARYLVRCGAFEVAVDERFDDETLERLLLVVSGC